MSGNDLLTRIWYAASTTERGQSLSAAALSLANKQPHRYCHLRSHATDGESTQGQSWWDIWQARDAAP